MDEHNTQMKLEIIGTNLDFYNVSSPGSLYVSEISGKAVRCLVNSDKVKQQEDPYARCSH